MAQDPKGISSVQHRFEEFEKPERLTLLLWILVVGAGYFFLGRVGLSLARVNPSATSVWPPSGMALAALLFWGFRVWPGVFLGAFLVNYTTQGSWAACLGIATGNTLEVVSAAFLVRHYAGGLKAFARPSGASKFVLIAGLSAVCASSIGVASLCWDGAARWDEFGRVWFSWWLGDTVSLLVFAPLLMVWGQSAERESSSNLRAALGVVAAVVFSAGAGFYATPYLRHSQYLTLPPLMWAAFRFGPRGATGSVFLMTLLSLLLTGRGIGPFTDPDPAAGPQPLMLFIGTLGISCLLLAAAVEHARLADVALQKAHMELAEHARGLERTVEARTQKLRETVQDLEAFSYSVAHDLRAPLRTIQGYSTLVQEEHGDKLEETGKDYLRRVICAASRLDRMIEDTLNYSKVVRDELKLEPVDTAATIRGVVDTYPNLQMHSDRIVLSGSFLWVLANPAAFSQIVSNLLGNAVKFVKPGVPPELRVWAEPAPGDAVRIWFEDNGIGIEKAVQSKIFEMFQRATSSSQYEGNGIGLSIVRKSAERMGGNVGVESEPGRGSRFWVVLKAAPKPLAG